MFRTREAARRLEIYAAQGLADHARERKQDLQRAVWDMTRALDAMKEMGASPAWLSDTLKGLHDEASNIDAACMKFIDAAEETAEPVDLSEIQP